MPKEFMAICLFLVRSCFINLCVGSDYGLSSLPGVSGSVVWYPLISASFCCILSKKIQAP